MPVANYHLVVPDSASDFDSPQRSRGALIRDCLVLYVCALSIRLLLIGLVHWEPDGDAGHYYTLAKGLIQARTYTDTFREPGYPLFVAALSLLSGDNLRMMYVLQAVVAAILPLAALTLFRLLLPNTPRMAFWLAMVVGVHPELASFSGLLLREAIFCVLITWLAACMVQAVRLPSFIRFAVVGLVGGACCMIRQEALSFVLLFAVYAAIRLVSREWSVKLKLVGLASLLLVIGPWMYRNWRYHDFVGLTATGGGVLFARAHYLDRSGSVEPAIRQLAEEVIRENNFSDADIRTVKVSRAMARSLEATGNGSTDAALQPALRRIAVENIRNHPTAFLKDGLKEFRSLFGGYSWHFAFPRWLDLPRWHESYERGLWGISAVKLLNGVAFPVVMWGLLAASLLYRPGTEDWKDAVFLLLAVMTFCVIISAIGFVENRFRDNYEPILLGICARGALALIHRFSRPAQIGVAGQANALALSTLNAQPSTALTATVSTPQPLNASTSP